LRLCDLANNTKAEIVGFAADASPDKESLIRAIIEMGLAVGTVVEILHAGPIGRDPLAVSCRGALIGLGRVEAQLILVKEKSQ
jgi:ferrous iron transport protein A